MAVSTYYKSVTSAIVCVKVTCTEKVGEEFVTFSKI